MPSPPKDADAAAMDEKLREDARAWSKANARGTQDVDRNFNPPVVPPAVAAARTPRAKPKAAAAPPVPAAKQPFKMSYDGTTDRDYIARRLALGAR